MNQFVLTKTINARRRRLRIRRVKYTCETTSSSSPKTTTHREISVLLTSTSDKSRNGVVLSSSEVKTAAVGGGGGGGGERLNPLISSCGSVSVVGGRKEMEDAVSVELGILSSSESEFDFFGVYDGHGGARVADACKEMLHKAVAEEILSSAAATGGGGIEWGEVMERSFGKVDRTVEEYGMMGSTAVVAVVGNDEVVVGNCGDSRAVLCRKGVAVPLSIDHKPDRPDELERIEAAGGRVINWNGPRVLGVLSTSRSIGDQYLKPYIIPTPEVIVHKRSKEDDQFLILASDGLWDVITNEVACQGGRAAEAAAVLAELAIAQGSSDNISVIVVELNGTNTSSTTSSSSKVG
ncbi:Probable protein phosphatase 2C 8 [Linum perenne]